MNIVVNSQKTTPTTYIYEEGGYGIYWPEEHKTDLLDKKYSIENSNGKKLGSGHYYEPKVTDEGAHIGINEIELNGMKKTIEIHNSRGKVTKAQPYKILKQHPEYTSERTYHIGPTYGKTTWKLQQYNTDFFQFTGCGADYGEVKIINKSKAKAFVDSYNGKSLIGLTKAEEGDIINMLRRLLYRCKK